MILTITSVDFIRVFKGRGYYFKYSLGLKDEDGVKYAFEQVVPREDLRTPKALGMAIQLWYWRKTDIRPESVEVEGLEFIPVVVLEIPEERGWAYWKHRLKAIWGRKS